MVRMQVAGLQSDFDDAKDSRDMAMATANRVAAQKMALMTAAGMVDTSDLMTQADIDAAEAAIGRLEAALATAVDVSDTDKAMYQSQVTMAKAAVAMAQTDLDTRGRMMAQRMTIETTEMAARSAVDAVGDESTDADVTAADNAIAALKKAIEDAADLPDDDAAIASAEGTLDTLEPQLKDAKDSREMAMVTKARDMAKKLHAGITRLGGTGADVRSAAYGTAEDANNIVVTSGDSPAITATLREDKEAMVDDLHGWTGKKYTSGGYEAVVYSNIGPDVAGDRFAEEYEGTNFDNETGVLTLLAAEVATNAPRVASSRFDQSAGAKVFELGTNDAAVMIPGTFHGVTGTYSCTPATDHDCAAQKVDGGFNLGGVGADNAFAAADGTWTFKPDDPRDKVIDADTTYASYGWWIGTPTTGFTASAFAADKGDVPNAVSIDALRGTAKYVGGAVGKYALYSSTQSSTDTTDGTNDSGHFTATATLEATFAAAADGGPTIEGTINNFMVGDDPESRDWSVKLNKAGISDTGGIPGSANGEDIVVGTNDHVGTVWTIDGTAGATSGQWSGSLQDNDSDGVPKVGSGTFYTEHGNIGKMVGAFGVNKQ